MTILQTARKAFSDHVYGVDHVLFFQFDLRTFSEVQEDGLQGRAPFASVPTLDGDRAARRGLPGTD